MYPRPYTQSSININQFKKITNKSKEGGYGLVYTVENVETKKIYAAKIIKNPNNDEFLDREIGILMNANHPTIVKFIGFSTRDFHGDNNITIIMELAEKGSLADILKQIRLNNIPINFTNTTRQLILIGISRGMKYLHDRNILHRDLKPDNVLLNNEYYPLITDFGMSKYFNVGHLKSQSREGGTLIYMAPEIIDDKPCGRKVDVYSFGILMFEVVTGLVPYPELINGKLGQFKFQSKVINENYRPKFENPIKKSIQELIERCWSSNIEDRPTFSELFNLLSGKEKENKGKYFLDDVDENQINKYVEIITKIDDPVEELNQKIESIEIQNIELKSVNDQLSLENERLKNDNDALSINAQKLINDVDQLSSEIQQLKKNNDQLISDNKKLKNDNLELSLNNEKMKNERESFINQNINNFAESNFFHLKPDLKILQTLGTSSFGQIFLIQNTNTNTKFITKLSNKTFSVDDEQISSLINQLSKVKNPAVLNITEIKQRDILNQNHITVTSKFMEDGSLQELISNKNNKYFKNSDLNKIQYINLLGIALGMQYLHSQNIVHGNLTLNNILLDRFLFPYITDFGLFKFIDNNSINFNNIVFTSPEILEGKIQEQDFKTDVYSYSMIAYSIIIGEIPSIEGSSSIMKIQNIIKGKRPNLTNIKNKDLKTFLQKCWCSNPRDRLSFYQIIEMLITKNIYSLFDINNLEELKYLIRFKNSSTIIQNLFNSLNIIDDDVNIFKIVCFGNCGTGKTALINTYYKQLKFVETTPTVGFDLFPSIQSKYENIMYNIMDTPGQEQFFVSIPFFLKGAHAVILFTDVNTHEEYKNLEVFIEYIFNNLDEIPLLYIATTKTDLGWNNTKEEIESYFHLNFKLNIKMFITSLDDLKSINFMFDRIIDDLVEKNQLCLIPQSNNECLIH